MIVLDDIKYICMKYPYISEQDDIKDVINLGMFSMDNNSVENSSILWTIIKFSCDVIDCRFVDLENFIIESVNKSDCVFWYLVSLVGRDTVYFAEFDY